MPQSYSITNTKVWNKLKKQATAAGLFLLFFLIISILTYIEVHEANKWIEFTQKERFGIEYNAQLRRLLQDVMHHRGAVIAYLSGDPSFTDKIEEDHSRIEADIRALESLNAVYGKQLGTDNAWNDFKKKWQELDYTEYSGSAGSSFDNHSAIIDAILAMSSLVGETSSLILDPEVTTYYLMDCITFKIPLLAENIGKTRAKGVSLLVKQNLNTITIRELASLRDLISYSLAQTNDRIEKILLSRPELRPQLEEDVRKLNGGVSDFLVLLDRGIIDRRETAIRPVDYYGAASKAIDGVFNLYDKESPILDELLGNRIYLYQKEKYTFITASLVILTIFIYVFTAFTREHNELLIANEKLRHHAVTDSLTQIYNRLKFNNVLELEIERARRFKHPFSIIMFDIDDFKEINDTFGHYAGDEALKSLGRLISGHVRTVDTFARWGGEEFVVLVVETPVEGARSFAEKLRQEIAATALCDGIKITCSFGVTGFKDSDDFTSLTRRVDQALYESKNGGKNRVCVK